MQCAQDDAASRRMKAYIREHRRVNVTPSTEHTIHRKRFFTSVQATTDDNSEQVREQPTQEASLAAARQEAARSKQLNIACNDVVRTILDGNPTNEKERAEALRQRLIAQKDDLVSPEDDMSALFFDNLLLVCEHELHPDIGILRGQYGKAWNTILHYIEDAGWQLTDPPFSISG